MVYDYDKLAGAKKYKGKIIIGAVLLFLAACLVAGSAIYLEIAQLDEIGGLSDIYVTNLIYKLIFSAGVFVVIFGLVTIANIFVKRNIKKYLNQNNLLENAGNFVKHMPNFLLSFVVALIGAVATKDFFYQKALNFMNSTPFGTKAPLIENDISYFVFERPFLMSFYQFVSALWVVIIIYTALYYIISMMLIFNNEITLEDFKVKSILRHNLINVAIFFLIKAVSYKFQQEGLLFSNFFNVKGAGYVDVNVWMNYFKVAPVLIVLIAAVSLWFMWRGKLKASAYAIAIFPAVWLLVAVTSGVVQNFFVKPNEYNYESQYIVCKRATKRN